MRKVKNRIKGHEATDQLQKLRKDSDTEPCSQILSPTLTKDIVDYVPESTILTKNLVSESWCLPERVKNAALFY
jgi:hypothetical protein